MPGMACHIMSCHCSHVISWHVVAWHLVLCHVMSCLLGHEMSWCVVSCFACHGTSYHHLLQVMSCNVASWYVVSCMSCMSCHVRTGNNRFSEETWYGLKVYLSLSLTCIWCGGMPHYKLQRWIRIILSWVLSSLVHFFEQGVFCRYVCVFVCFCASLCLCVCVFTVSISVNVILPCKMCSMLWPPTVQLLLHSELRCTPRVALRADYCFFPPQTIPLSSPWPPWKQWRLAPRRQWQRVSCWSLSPLSMIWRPRIAPIFWTALWLLPRRKWKRREFSVSQVSAASKPGLSQQQKHALRWSSARRPRWRQSQRRRLWKLFQQLHSSSRSKQCVQHCFEEHYCSIMSVGIPWHVCMCAWDAH